MTILTKPTQTATQNACKLCEPLGACFVFRGIEGAIPLLHGSQGCSTYIRRYMIGHFREPVDIASSSFSETTAIFGGESNLREALENVTRQYHPRMIGVATTCLSETIGDDLKMMLHGIGKGQEGGPVIVPVSTPSYQGTHMDGFHAAVCAVLDRLAKKTSDIASAKHVNLLPGLVSPEDIRYLKEIFSDFDLIPTFLPDYSETLDGPAGVDYQAIPKGGTTLEEIMGMGHAAATVAFGSTIKPGFRGGDLLNERFQVPHHFVGMPIGVKESDLFFQTLEAISGQPTPEAHVKERGRLVDSYIDAHKHVFGKRAVVYGEEDLVVGLASFLAEIGVKPVVCASGGNSGNLQRAITERLGATQVEEMTILEDADFADIADVAEASQPDFLIGNSKGYPVARRLQVPLLRVGFPIHDRFGAQRVLHVGYRGTQQLFDRLVNMLIEKMQDDSPVGYGQI